MHCICQGFKLEMRVSVAKDFEKVYEVLSREGILLQFLINIHLYLFAVMSPVVGIGNSFFDYFPYCSCSFIDRLVKLS